MSSLVNHLDFWLSPKILFWHPIICTRAAALSRAIIGSQIDTEPHCIICLSHILIQCFCPRHTKEAFDINFVPLVCI